MVVTMKKLELLLYHLEREQFLQSLRSLGVVHLVEQEQPDTPHIQELAAAVRQTDRVLAALRKIRSEKALSFQPNSSQQEASKIVLRFIELEEKLDKAEQELVSLRKDMTTLEPWGNFDPAKIKNLETIGVKLRFLILPQKSFEALEKKDLALEVISQSGGQVCFAVIERGESSPIDAEEARLPDISLGELQSKIAQIDAERVSVRIEMEHLTAHIGALEKHQRERSGQHSFEKASLSMEKAAEGKLLALKGWFPAHAQKKIEKFLDQFAVWFNISHPQPNDQPPVLLKNNAFAKLFEPITKVYSLPDSVEIDPTPFFAPFFMFFVGMCLGDVGYGGVLFLLGIIVYLKTQATMRGISILIMLLGASTMLNGVLLNSFFGSALFADSSAGKSFSILSPVTGENGTTYPAMQFAMIVGLLQVNFGIILAIINRFRTDGVQGMLQPIGYLLMVIGGLSWLAQADPIGLKLGEMAIGPYNIGFLLMAIPLRADIFMIGGGLVLHMLFNNPGIKMAQRVFDPTKGVLELYFFISGFLGNVLSYLRLFALGLAGGLLGAAYTQIAMMFITSADGRVVWASPMAVFTILVLIIGHSLNFVLSAIGSFVHPLRLTFVEFYSNLGFRGNGKPYTPFAHIENGTEKAY